MVVQQDREAADYIRHGLMQAGHVVDSLRNGLDALVHGTSSSFDLVIVDRELPDLDGVSLVRGLRAAGLSIPVLFVAAGNVQDRVEGLQAGGDDYLVKPFSFLELLARVTALGRRPPQRVEQVVLHIADLEFDMLRRTCRRAETNIHLLPRETTLLEYMMLNKGRVLPRTLLLERVWDAHFDPQTSVVETHISRLRAKVDRPFSHQLIHTIRQTGYAIYE